MSSSEQRTHYQVLGVSAAAPPAEIRRSYRQLAYLLHPDRQGDGTPAEQRLAERRMREVNAAWTTLSDPARRRDYDRSLAATARGPATTTTTRSTAGSTTGSGIRPEDHDDPDAELARARLADVDPDEPDLSPAHFWLLRRAPIVLALLVGAVLFVVTAYAGGGNDTPGTATAAPPLSAGANCISRQDNLMAYTVSCASTNDGTIVKHVTKAEECISDGTEVALVNNEFVCVRKTP